MLVLSTNKKSLVLHISGAQVITIGEVKQQLKPKKDLNLLMH